jgi:hypothetical protein
MDGWFVLIAIGRREKMIDFVLNCMWICVKGGLGFFFIMGGLFLVSAVTYGIQLIFKGEHS